MGKDKKRKGSNKKLAKGITLMGIVELYPEINTPEFITSPDNTIELMCATFKIALNKYLKDKSRTPKNLCLRFLLEDCDQEIKRSEKGSKREELLFAIRLLIEME